MQSAEDPKTVKICPDKWGEDNILHEFISTLIDDSLASDDKINANKSIPIIDIEDLIGKSFPVVDKYDNNDNITITDILEKHQNNIKEDPTQLQFKVQCNSSEYKDIMVYKEYMEIIKTSLWWETCFWNR